MTDLQRTLKLKFRENEYLIEFPKVKQYSKIEALKQQYSEGQYGSMLASRLKSQFDALEMIDVMAYFGVLMPYQFFKDMNKTSLEEMDAIDFKEIVKVYNEQFLPWYNNWYDLLSKVNEDK